jgi:hypothetical protein
VVIHRNPLPFYSEEYFSIPSLSFPRIKTHLFSELNDPRNGKGTNKEDYLLFSGKNIYREENTDTHCSPHIIYVVKNKLSLFYLRDQKITLQFHLSTRRGLEIGV